MASRSIPSTGWRGQAARHPRHGAAAQASRCRTPLMGWGGMAEGRGTATEGGGAPTGRSFSPAAADHNRRFSAGQLVFGDTNPVIHPHPEHNALRCARGQHPGAAGPEPQRSWLCWVVEAGQGLSSGRPPVPRALCSPCEARSSVRPGGGSDTACQRYLHRLFSPRFLLAAGGCCRSMGTAV